MGMFMLRKILLRSAKGLSFRVYGSGLKQHTEYWEGYRAGLRFAAKVTLGEILLDRERRIEEIKKEDMA